MRRVLKSVSIPVVFSLGKVKEGRFGLDWLESFTAGKQLVDPKSKAIFPKLKNLGFWKALRFMSMNDATVYLQGKLESVNTQTVSFFGVSVNKTLSLWAGPLVCFMLEWLILRHLKKLNTEVVEA